MDEREAELWELLESLKVKSEYFEALNEEMIEVGQLGCLSDQDLKEMGLPKGVRMKLLKWAQTKVSQGAQGEPAGFQMAPGMSQPAEQSQTTRVAAVAPHRLSSVPSSFCCPISTFIMEDPVVLKGGERVPILIPPPSRRPCWRQPP